VTKPAQTENEEDRGQEIARLDKIVAHA
jgi:hypothetical protein